MTRPKRVFSAEFREKAVAYVSENDKTIAAAARDLGIGESTLANWVSTARNSGSGSNDRMPSESEQLRQLRNENRELRMRVELLKKAAAFFANETQN